MKNHSNSKTGSRSKVDNLTLVNSPTTNPPNIGEANMSWIQLVTHHWKNQVRSPEVCIHWSENIKFIIFGKWNQYSHELDAGHVSHDLVLGLGNIFQLGVWENRVHHTVPLKSLIPIMYTALRPKMCSFLDEGLWGKPCPTLTFRHSHVALDQIWVGCGPWWRKSTSMRRIETSRGG